jgi:hypothetical protein
MGNDGHFLRSEVEIVQNGQQNIVSRKLEEMFQLHSITLSHIPPRFSPPPVPFSSFPLFKLVFFLESLVQI